MSTQPNDTAFPYPIDLGVTEGLSKREYFAALAMQGLLANQEFVQRAERLQAEVKDDNLAPIVIAEVARKCADALIEALNN